MEVKTAKILEVRNVSPWNGPNGTLYYHHLVLDNGDKIDIGKKTEMKTGWEVTYSITGDPGQHEFTKAKSEKKEGGNFFANKNKSMNGGKSSQASFALAYAKDWAGFYISKGVDKTPSDVLEAAEVFNKWLQEN